MYPGTDCCQMDPNYCDNNLSESEIQQVVDDLVSELFSEQVTEQVSEVLPLLCFDELPEEDGPATLHAPDHCIEEDGCMAETIVVQEHFGQPDPECGEPGQGVEGSSGEPVRQGTRESILMPDGVLPPINSQLKHWVVKPYGDAKQLTSRINRLSFRSQ